MKDTSRGLIQCIIPAWWLGKPTSSLDWVTSLGLNSNRVPPEYAPEQSPNEQTSWVRYCKEWTMKGIVYGLHNTEEISVSIWRTTLPGCLLHKDRERWSYFLVPMLNPHLQLACSTVLYVMEHGIKKPSIYGNLTEDCLILIQVQSSESNNSVIGKLKLLIAIIFSLRF